MNIECKMQIENRILWGRVQSMGTRKMKTPNWIFEGRPAESLWLDSSLRSE